MDVVQEAIDLYENEQYEGAFELASQFDKYQQDTFFKATGQTSEVDRMEGRKLIGAYKIQSETDQEKIDKYMKLYDSLVLELEGLK